MKRKTLLALACGLAVSASATTGLKSATITNPASTKSELRGLQIEMSAIQKERPAASSVRRAPESDTWVSRGEITYTDDFLSSFFSIEFESVKIPIEESVEHPGYFRLQDPYTYLLFYNNILSSLNVYDDWWYIDATNPDKVVAETYNTGYNLNSQIGTMAISSYAYLYRTQLNYTDDQIEELGLFGKYADNAITFPQNALAIYGSVLKNWYKANKNGNFRIAFPGAKDYSIKTSISNCSDNNVFSINVELGDDVAGVKYIVLKGNYTRNESNFQHVPDLDGAQTLTPAGTSFTLPLDLSDIKDDCQIITVLFATLDEEGNYAGGSGNYCFVINDNNDQWKPMGKTTFVEDLYASQMENKKSATLTAEIQEKIGTPGYFRLVNPYAGHEDNEAVESHNHYMYIDATDPEKVVIPASPIGFNGGFGMAMVASASDKYGTYADGKITFEAAAMLYAEDEYQNGSFYLAGNGEFCINIPDMTFYIGIPDEEDEAGAFVAAQELRFTPNAEHPGNLELFAPAGTLQGPIVVMNQSGGMLFGAPINEEFAVYGSGYYTLVYGELGTDEGYIAPISAYLLNDATLTFVDNEDGTAQLIVAEASGKLYFAVGENITEVCGDADENFSFDLPEGTESFMVSTAGPDADDFATGMLCLPEGEKLKHGVMQNLVSGSEPIELESPEGEWTITIGIVDEEYVIMGFNKAADEEGDEEGDEDGINSVVMDSDAAAEYFNVQGIRVQQPASGLYIVRKGGKVSKILVK